MDGPTKTKRIGKAPGSDRDAAQPSAPAVTIRAPPNVKPGAMIGDKYRVDCELGRGGYGVVVRALHLTLDQKVAIKVLTEGEGSTDAEFAEDAARFRREAKATAALRGDHVVRVLDVDLLDGVFPYIVMEHLEGRTLHELIYAKPVVAFDEAVDIILEVLAALAEAHAAGIVHRDLKPANVFLAKGLGGTTIAKVLDFGVSKMIAGASQGLTRTGAVVGTVAYMAPEQMLDAKRVDGRADLWSAGLVLYEALAKKHPFGSSTAGPKVVTAILNDPLVPLRALRPDTPPGLDAVIARLLEKAPERRYATALETANALAPFGSSRARPVLDEIRRAPPPKGAAAPAPPSAVDAVRPATPSARGRGKVSTAATLLLAFATATFIIASALTLFMYVKPRIARRVVEAPPPAASTHLRPATPSADAGR